MTEAQLLSIPAAAKLLGVTHKTAYAWIAATGGEWLIAGEVRVLRAGTTSHMRVSRPQLERHLGLSVAS